MFENFGRFAEQVATDASRRQFLGCFGRGALAVAAAVGGMLALPTISRGDKPPPIVCDANSYTTCIGAGEGAMCSRTGRCQRIGNTSSCTCKEPGPPPRR